MISLKENRKTLFLNSTQKIQTKYYNALVQLDCRFLSSSIAQEEIDRNVKSKNNTIRGYEPCHSHPNNDDFPGVSLLNDLRGRVR